MNASRPEPGQLWRVTVSGWMTTLTTEDTVLLTIIAIDPSDSRVLCWHVGRSIVLPNLTWYDDDWFTAPGSELLVHAR